MGTVLDLKPKLVERAERQRRHPAGLGLRWRTRDGRRGHLLMSGNKRRTRCGVESLFVIAEEGVEQCSRC